MHKRQNPICSQPEVIVSNPGNTAIQSIDFSYGVAGGPVSTYTWNGSLAPYAKADILLPQPLYTGTGFPDFKVEITGVNGGADNNSQNNIIYSQVPMTKLLPNTFIINLRTNNAPEQNSYTLKDAGGNVLYSRSGMQANTLYKDTVQLGNSCYTFQLTDEGDNGLDWWAAPDEGKGYLRFNKVSGPMLVNFNPDFGSGITYNFNTTYGLSVPKNDPAEKLSVYPNPANDIIAIDFSAIHFQTGRLSITDARGRQMNSEQINAKSSEYKLNVSQFVKGVYFIRLQAEDAIYTEKMVVE
jgi:hypothetical protein